MTTNKIIAEKINVFLNLLFHLEDYVNNKKIREEQLHVANNVKIILSEVTDSSKVKEYFFKGADLNNENEEKDKESKFKVMRLTDDEKRYIKKVNPQSLNQKNLQSLNFFFDSTGEADMINDSIKVKMLDVIKFCLTQAMNKKFKKKEKEIYSKINFVLRSNNSNLYQKLENSHNKLFSKNKFTLTIKNRSMTDLKERFRVRPNFIIPPPIKQSEKKLIISKKDFDNYKNKSEEYYYKTNFPKNYKLIQKKENSGNLEKLPKILKDSYKNKMNITPSTQLVLIDILHNKKKKYQFNKKALFKLIKKEFNFNSYVNNYINEDEEVNKIQEKKIQIFNDKIKQDSAKKNKKNSGEKINEKRNNNAKEFQISNFSNMYEVLKERGFI